MLSSKSFGNAGYDKVLFITLLFNFVLIPSLKLNKLILCLNLSFTYLTQLVLLKYSNFRNFTFEQHIEWLNRKSRKNNQILEMKFIFRLVQQYLNSIQSCTWCTRCSMRSSMRVSQSVNFQHCYQHHMSNFVLKFCGQVLTKLSEGISDLLNIDLYCSMPVPFQRQKIL